MNDLNIALAESMNKKQGLKKSDISSIQNDLVLILQEIKEIKNELGMNEKKKKSKKGEQVNDN